MADKKDLTLLDRIQQQIDSNLQNQYNTQKAAAFQALDRLKAPAVGPQLPPTTPEEAKHYDNMANLATMGSLAGGKPLLKGLPTEVAEESIEDLIRIGSPKAEDFLMNIAKKQNIQNRALDRSEALTKAVSNKRKALVKKIQDYYRK